MAHRRARLSILAITLTTRFLQNARACRSSVFFPTEARRTPRARRNCVNWELSKFCTAFVIWRNSGHEKSKATTHHNGNGHSRELEPGRPGSRENLHRDSISGSHADVGRAPRRDGFGTHRP